MDFGKLRLPAALALIAVASFVTFLQVKANEDTDDPVGQEAVWNPESDDLSDIAQACNTQKDYGPCFLDQMEDLAPSEAVDFSQSLLEQTPSHAGYLAELREDGLVDLGIVAYPRAEGPRLGWVLVNGLPTIVDVDNLDRLPRAAMEKDPKFAALRKSYPKIRLAVDPDERAGGAMPEIRGLSNGGQRFVIGYALKEDCASCAAVAHASFGFDFDAAGKFLGAKFLQVSPITQ